MRTASVKILLSTSDTALRIPNYHASTKVPAEFNLRITSCALEGIRSLVCDTRDSQEPTSKSHSPYLRDKNGSASVVQACLTYCPNTAETILIAIMSQRLLRTLEETGQGVRSMLVKSAPMNLADLYPREVLFIRNEPHPTRSRPYTYTHGRPPVFRRPTSRFASCGPTPQFQNLLPTGGMGRWHMNPPTRRPPDALTR